MLKGKTALVTGSTSGIGLGIAKALAAQGANVVLNGFGDHEGPQREVEQAGAAYGITTAYHGADMSKPAEIEAMRRFSDAFNAGEVNDLRAGGDVPGEWRENVDTVPALLVEGEGVLNAEAMALGGEKVMEDLNAKGLALREQGITPHDIKRGIGLRGLKKVKA